MNRRNFIRMLGSSIFVPVVEPVVKYILPPIGGWHSGIVYPQTFVASEIEPYIEFIYNKGLMAYCENDVKLTRQLYLDIRANNSPFAPRKRG